MSVAVLGTVCRAAATVVLTALTGLASGCAKDDAPRSLADVAPAVGECFVAPSADTPEGAVFEVVDCSQEHHGEVVGRAVMSAGAEEPTPAVDAMRTRSIDACVPTFEEYVGIAYLQSRFTLQPIAPSSELWASGDRNVVCVVVELEAVIDDDGAPGGVQPVARSGSVAGTAQ